MTIDQALQMAAQKMDKIFVETVEKNFARMVEDGLTDDEIATFQKFESDNWPTARAEALAQLRAKFQLVCLQRGAEEFKQRWDVA
jgi:hypothetical protein